MQFKSVKGNIVYAIFVFIIIFAVFSMDYYFKQQIVLEFEVGPSFAFIAIGYPIIGVAIGLPSLWKQFQEKGTWKVNIPRLLLLGIPTFLLANFAFIALSLRKFIEPLLLEYTNVLTMTVASTYVFQVFFGFILVTSFYKQEKRNQQEYSVNPEIQKKESLTDGTL